MQLTTFILLAALASTAVAQQPAASTERRPMTFADLMALKRVSDPQISPSGKWVLFSVTDVSLEHNTKTNHLWVVPLVSPEQAGSAKEHQLTFGPGESNGRFAPDGKTISLTMKDQIFEMPWDDAAGSVGDAIQVTNVNGGADGAIWSPDSRRLLFTVTVYPDCSDLGDWAKEDACDVAKQKAADASPVKAQIWTHLLYRHWDHYLGDRRSHIAVVDADSGRNLRDLTPRSAVGDAETPTFSLGGPLGYAWAPDSHEIAYETNLEVGFAKTGVFPQPGESTNNDIFILKLDEHPTRAWRVSTSSGSDDGPQYSPDGKWLAWRSQTRNGYESDKFNLVVMDRATTWDKPGPTIKNLTLKFDNWIDEFIWSRNSEEIYFAAPSQGREPAYSVKLSDGSIASLNENEPNGEFSSLQVAPSNRTLVVAKMKVDKPSEIIAIHLDQMSPKIIDPALHSKSDERALANAVTAGGFPEFFYTTQLTHGNDELISQLDLSKLESFWFPGANGTRVQGFLITPPNFDPSKKYPVKFLMHGGPQTAWGDAWSYRWNWELFAANGYVVIGINRRGSTGYGQKFVEEVSGDWGGRAYVDLMRGLDYAEQHYSFIDKSRECALGASYGGYMADWVLTHTNRFKCIVTHDGMSDPAAAFGTTEELWFNEWEFRPLSSDSRAASSRPFSKNLSSRPERSGAERPAFNNADSTTNPDATVEENHPAHPWDFYEKPASEDPFRKWSPMYFIKNAHTPTLIIHSQRDYRLDVSEGLQLFTALQLLGVPSKMLYFPDEGHWVLKPQNSQLWYSTVNDWCGQWLGMNKYASVGPPAERMPNPAAVK